MGHLMKLEAQKLSFCLQWMHKNGVINVDTYRLKMGLYMKHVWQSRVEIKHHSVAQFNRITAFEAL